MYNYVLRMCVSQYPLCVCISSLLCVQVSGNNREAQLGRWHLGETPKHAAGEADQQCGRCKECMAAEISVLITRCCRLNCTNAINDIQ